jgi:hypothetical protein
MHAVRSLLSFKGDVSVHILLRSNLHLFGVLVGKPNAHVKAPSDSVEILFTP